MYVSLCSRRIRRFRVVVVQWTSKASTKKPENQLLLFFFSRCRLSLCLLKLPDGLVDVVFLDLVEAFERLFRDTHYNGIRSHLALLLSNWRQPTCCSQQFCFFVVATIIRFASRSGPIFFVTTYQLISHLALNSLLTIAYFVFLLIQSTIISPSSKPSIN